MKKTLTVNLNGMVFHIDEDAYQQLHEYLNAVRASLDLSDDKDEIMADIEARIAELLTEEYSKYHTTIATVEIVRTIMTRLGEPKDYAMDSSVEDTQENTRTRRRYYRDAENAMLGGVAAGLAAFLGWDVVWIRLIFVGLILLGQGWPIFVYVLMWIIAKPALTVAQKLEMKGEPVTINTIQEGFNEMAPQIPSTSKKIMRILGVILKVCFFVALAFFGFIAFVVIGALFLAFMGVSMGFLGAGIGTIGALPAMFMDWTGLLTMLQPWQVLMCKVSIILLCVAPLIIIVAGCINLLTKRRWTGKKFNLSFCLVWIIALCTLIFALISSVGLRQKMIDMALQLDTWDDDTSMPLSTMAYEVMQLDTFNAIDAEGVVSLILVNGPEQSVAVRPAMMTQYVHVEDSVLTVKNDQKTKMELLITTPQIDKFELAGACRLKNNDLLQTSTLAIFADGAADIDLTMAVEQLKLNLAGASKVELQGSAKQADFNLQGAVDLDADELSLATLNLAVDGTADAEVWVRDSLEVSANGFSQIVYKGNPVMLIKEKSWGVKMRREND